MRYRYIARVAYRQLKWDIDISTIRKSLISTIEIFFDISTIEIDVDTSMYRQLILCVWNYNFYHVNVPLRKDTLIQFLFFSFFFSCLTMNIIFLMQIMFEFIQIIILPQVTSFIRYVKLEAVVSLRVRHNFINQLGRSENYLYPNNSEALRGSSKLLYNI